MLELINSLPSFFLFILPLLFFHLSYKFFVSKNPKSSQCKATTLPKPYPMIGHLIPLSQHKSEQEFLEWLSTLVVSSPSSTFVLHQPFGGQIVFTGHPASVEHILKINNHNYLKGPHHKTVFQDVFGDSVVTINGEAWKFQRQISSHIFTPKSLKNYLENIVDFELKERLIPILSIAAKNKEVIDLQHILQRFTFDNICSIAFGYDPEYLLPSLPRAKFSDAFDDAIAITFNRFTAAFPIAWKTCRFLNIGDEKRLKSVVKEIREFATKIVNEKKQAKQSSIEGNNLLSRLLKFEELDEKLVIDIVTTFIFAGRDPTSAGLTWFFWLLHKNQRVEKEIVKEITKSEGVANGSMINEIKDNMSYTHGALCETMRLYPPVPMDTKQAAEDDVLPDGTPIKKGMLVTYVMYAMGRSKGLWGSNWAEFQPERWLKEEVDDASGEMKWKFVPRDAFSYPVFNAGPRTCPGREMAILQMKRIVAGVLRRFKVVSALEEGFEPVYVPSMTSKMQGGFPVRIEERVHVE